MGHIRLAWGWRGEDGAVKMMVLASATIGHLMFRTHSFFSPSRNWLLKFRSWPVCRDHPAGQESLERNELAVNFGVPDFWGPLPLFINFPFVCCLYLFILIKDIFLSLATENCSLHQSEIHCFWHSFIGLKDQINVTGVCYRICKKRS